jgi:hypothetical protein
MAIKPHIIHDQERFVARMKALGATVAYDGPVGTTLWKPFTVHAKLHIFPDGQLTVFAVGHAHRAMHALLAELDEVREVAR